MAEGGAVRLARRLLAGLLLLAAFGLLLGLGTWQMQRLAWKEQLIADIEARRHAPPQSLEEIERIAASGEQVDYRAMRAQGHFLHDKERHFFATYEGRTGYYVYTPLELADGRLLFVNRGFVPYDNKEQSTRRVGLIEGEQVVTGLARDRLSEKPSSLVPDNDPAKNIFYWKDLDAMAATDGLPAEKILPFFLDADATPVPGGLPIGGVTVIALPNNHLQYALTWYGLAAALAGVTAFALLRRKPHGEAGV